MKKENLIIEYAIICKQNNHIQKNSMQLFSMLFKKKKKRRIILENKRPIIIQFAYKCKKKKNLIQI